jgi:hypothetical protein
MDQAAKKPIMIGIIVGCLIIAGAITFMARSGNKVPGSFAGKQIWVKCRDCGATYQISKKAYFDYQQEHDDPTSPAVPVMVCRECGKKSVYRAVKCEKCGKIFEFGTVPNDYQDRCPECGYSKKETERTVRRVR